MQTILDKLRINELYKTGNQLEMTPKNVLDFQNLGYSVLLRGDKW